MAPKLDPPPSTQTCTVDHRTSRSGLTSAVQYGLKPFGTYLIKPGDPSPPGSLKLDVDKSVYEHCNVNERVVEGIRLYDIIPRSIDEVNTSSQHMNPGPTTIGSASTTVKLVESSNSQTGSDMILSISARKKKHIYYFAGGGWQNQATTQHWTLCAHLALELTSQGYPTTISVVSYPLAPNSPSAIAFPQLERLYRALLPSDNAPVDSATDAEEIIFAGDSAGGNIALALPLHVLSTDASAPAPDSLMLISPAVDLRNVNPDMAMVDHDDPMLSVKFVKETAKAWCGGDMDPADPRVSPLLGNVEVLARRGVQVNGVIAGYDVLAPDCVLFVKKCQEAGVRGRWLHWDKQMHCFPLAYKYKLMKEATEAAEWMVQILKGNI